MALASHSASSPALYSLRYNDAPSTLQSQSCFSPLRPWTLLLCISQLKFLAAPSLSLVECQSGGHNGFSLTLSQGCKGPPFTKIFLVVDCFTPNVSINYHQHSSRSQCAFMIKYQIMCSAILSQTNLHDVKLSLMLNFTHTWVPAAWPYLFSYVDT